jgi:hypothetical protein
MVARGLHCPGCGHGGDGAAGAADVGGVAFLALRAHSRQATNRQAMASHAPVAQRCSQAVLAPRRLAIRGDQAEPRRARDRVARREPQR